jgi:3-dehydroquinate dehydratase-1
MQINYCLPIIRQRKAEVLKVIQENKDAYHYFEIWLDYVSDIDDAFISEVSDNLEDRLILLFRRQKLEAPMMPEEARQTYLTALHNKKSYIDLDITTQQKDIDYIAATQLSLPLILSYHNYQATPEDKLLHEILSHMETYSPAVYKFATFCQFESDALRLLQLLLMLKKHGKRFIVLGMGEYGIITRIFGSIWGNDMLFAPQTTGEQTAPGQLTREQVEKIFTIIHSKD